MKETERLHFQIEVIISILIINKYRKLYCSERRIRDPKRRDAD